MYRALLRASFASSLDLFDYNIHYSFMYMGHVSLFVEYLLWSYILGIWKRGYCLYIWYI